MKPMIGLKLYVATAALAAALVAGGCAMMEPKAERYVTPPLGSTWTQAQRNTGSYGTGSVNVPVKSAERIWEGKRVAAFSSPQQVILANPDGSWPAMLAPDDKPVLSYDPPIGFEWPLEVGKTWTKNYRMTNHATKQTTSFDSTWKVEAYEDVTVPAGTFKAFKISYSSTLGEQNVWWYDPQLGVFVKQSLRRTERSPSGPGTREIELFSQTITK
jgi:hypothetical protein